MEKRLLLHQTLKDILGSGNVYFQPPSNITMKYPAIVYERSRIESRHADNKPFIQKTRYTVTVIDQDPDSQTVGKIAALPLCAHDRHFVVSQLNHDAFTLYF